LPSDITEKSLKQTFEIYGTVDNIEIFTKPNQIFAFLRYEKVAQASKAFENVDSLGLQLRAGLKISFSDYLKRNNIVGDSVSAEDVIKNKSERRRNDTILILMLFERNSNSKRIIHQREVI
jgi:RNA recognition motif-containing protein